MGFLWKRSGIFIPFVNYVMCIIIETDRLKESQRHVVVYFVRTTDRNREPKDHVLAFFVGQRIETRG